MLKQNQVTVDQIEVVQCPTSEAETYVGWMRGDQTVTIFSSDNTMLTKLKKAMAKNPNQWTCFESGRNRDGRVVGYLFTATRKAVRIVGGAPSTRPAPNNSRSGEGLKRYRAQQKALKQSKA